MIFLLGCIWSGPYNILDEDSKKYRKFEPDRDVPIIREKGIGAILPCYTPDGFSSSSEDCFRDGAYANIVGGGSYRSNLWKIDDVKIFVSK